jgi:threonine/homoserine/homoserine lactone efflux protein
VKWCAAQGLPGFSAEAALTPANLAAFMGMLHFGRQAGGGFDIGFGKGVALQFVNIKAWMNALLISAGWVTVADPLWPRLALVLPLMMAYGLASNFTYALVGSSLRGWLSQGQRLLWFNRALGMVLVVTAAWMLTV